MATKSKRKKAMARGDRLTIKDVARELEVDERTVRRWIKDGKLKYVGFDIRRRYLVDRADLDEFVRERTEKRDTEETKLDKNSHSCLLPYNLTHNPYLS